MELVSAEVDRFQTLVNDLLELARSDQPAHREPTDMPGLVARVCRARSISPDLLEVQPGTPSRWRVDRRRIEQVLGNLVDNATRYGGGLVAVRLGDAGDDRCFIEVDDDGPGIAEANRTAIFDRFVRGPAAHARGGGDGTGLGLAIVAQHATAHGGSVTVGDRPGGGARFRVELAGCGD